MQNKLGMIVADWRWKETRLDSQMLRFEGAGLGDIAVMLEKVDDEGGGKMQGKERIAASEWLRKSLVPFKS